MMVVDEAMLGVVMTIEKEKSHWYVIFKYITLYTCLSLR